MRMIFVNLPIKNLDASRTFFAALGFSFNPEFSDNTCACMVVEENIYVMLLTETRFRDFITGDVANAHRNTEVITCLSADSRAEVDKTYSLAIAAGGRPWKPTMDLGPMYGCSFQDLDGHVWELMHMAPKG